MNILAMNAILIGASLSEPHTSETALHTHLCMLVASGHFEACMATLLLGTGTSIVNLSPKQVSDCNSTQAKDFFGSLHSQHSIHTSHVNWRCVTAHHFHGLSCLLLDELQSWINIAVKQTEHVLLHMEEGRRREREREGEREERARR